MDLLRLILLATVLWTLPAIAHVSTNNSDGIGNGNTASCMGSGKNTICAAIVDSYYVFTADAGAHWSNIPINSKNYLNLFSVSCKKGDVASPCLMVGLTIRGDRAHIPLKETGVLVKADTSIMNWEYDPSSLFSSVPFAVSCFGNTPTCLTVGIAGDTMRSVDGGQTWNALGGQICKSALNCFSSNNISTCLGGDNEPSIAITTDAGSTWTKQTIAQFPDGYTYVFVNSISCTDNSSSGFCAAVGDFNDALFTHQFFIAQSTDGGNHWVYVPIKSSIPDSFLYAVHCSKNSESSICVAVGSKKDAIPFLLQTKNQGKTWEEVDLKTIIPDGGKLTSVYCGAYGSHLICTAGVKGGSLSLSTTSLIQTENGGDTWFREEFKNQYYGTDYITCNDSNDVCMAVTDKYTGTDSVYAIFMSTDGRKTWALSSVMSRL
jgi:photosystem II stability/assembly factor-like uncharacterized protein